MTQLPIIDTHVHFWDLHHPELHYSWLQQGAVHPFLTRTEVDRLGSSNYTVDDYLADIAGSDVVGCVHVQNATAMADPVVETSWLQEAADLTGWPQAIIAYVDLSSDGVQETLERHAEHANFRGVRDYRYGSGEYLLDPRWERGFRLLGELDLVCSMDCTVETMPDIDALLGRCPRTTVVIDHMGFPQSRSDEFFDRWSNGMRRIAQHERALCKISEVGMVEHGWTPDRIRRWLLACVEIFGPDRCVFGTNWPVDKLYSSYGELVSTYREVIRGYSESEQRAMLAENARTVYRIRED